MLANDNIKKLKNKSLNQIQVVNVCFFVFFPLWVLLGPLNNLLPMVGIYNLFFCEIMNFCGKSPRFEKKKSRKIATFLYMVQVGNKKI